MLLDRQAKRVAGWCQAPLNDADAAKLWDAGYSCWEADSIWVGGPIPEDDWAAGERIVAEVLGPK